MSNKLNLPLFYDEKYGHIYDAKHGYLAQVDPDTHLSQSDCHELGNLICEAVNVRPQLEKRIEELENALRHYADESNWQKLAYLSTDHNFYNGGNGYDLAREVLAKGEGK